MIKFSIKDARKKKNHYGAYYVLHPSNDAILAYCDTEKDADEAIALLNKVCEDLTHDPALTAACACFTIPD